MMGDDLANISCLSLSNVCTEKTSDEETIPKSVKTVEASLEELLKLLKASVEVLLDWTDFSSKEVRPNLKFIQRHTRYGEDLHIRKHIVGKLYSFGVVHVHLNVWKSVSAIDYSDEVNIIAFKNLQSSLSIIWNCSDCCIPLCHNMISCGLVLLFISELRKLHSCSLDNENNLYLVKAYLGILHNITRLLSIDCRPHFVSCNAVELLQKYLHVHVALVKTKAYLILAYIISDEESDIINATDSHIAYIISILEEALESGNFFSRTHAFWASEIIDGLNHMARNDGNKVKIGRLGGLRCYTRLLDENFEECSLVASGLWILSFHLANRPLILREPECFAKLQALAVGGKSDNIRRSAKGALWVLKEGKSTQDKAEYIPHVMLSYQWSSRSLMLYVRDILIKAGYNVWMDVDNMSGSTLEAMALAVEQASVILVGMCQAYKDSPNCRTEAEYAYQRKKDIIPLLIESNYVPDGWLGILVGTKLYFDVSSKDNCTKVLPNLIKELGNRGRLEGSQVCEEIFSQTSQESHCSSVSSMHSYILDCQHWNQGQVLEWLKANELEVLTDKLKDFDGSLMVEYKKMLKNAPEYFYRTTQVDLGLNLRMSLHFAKVLNKLSI